MPLPTDCILTGTWPQIDGVTASGHVIVEPVQSVTGGGYIVVDVPVTVPLVDGHISKAFTSLAGVQLRVTERIRGARADVPPYVVTPVAGTLDLSTAPRGTGDTIPTYVLGSSVGQPGGVAALDGTGKVPAAQLPASGGGSTLAVRRAYVTTGNISLPDTSGTWAVLSGLELAIPAAVGDDVQLGVHAMRSDTPGSFVDVAVVVGSTPVRFLSSGTATPAVEGDPGWYPGGFVGQSAPRGFAVAPGDRDGGNVRFVVVAKAAGTGTVYASAAYPFYWQADNRGPAL